MALSVIDGSRKRLAKTEQIKISFENLNHQSDPILKRIKSGIWMLETIMTNPV